MESRSNSSRTPWAFGVPVEIADQVGAHLIGYRHLEEQLAPIVGLGAQHLFTQVVGNEPIGATELRDEVVRVFVKAEVHAGQLQACGPSLSPVDECGDAVGAERLSGDAFEELGGVRVIECEVDLADLRDVQSHPLAAPGDGQVRPGREDQMDVARQQLRQSGQVGDECSVRQVVQVLQDDDHLRKLCHLHCEVVEKSIAKSLSVHGGQRAHVDEDSVDLGQFFQESPAEAHGVIVAGYDLEPDELQLGMRGSPLGQEDRFPSPCRRDDEGDAVIDDSVQFPPQGGTVDHVGRLRRCLHTCVTAPSPRPEPQCATSSDATAIDGAPPRPRGTPGVITLFG